MKLKIGLIVIVMLIVLFPSCSRKAQDSNQVQLNEVSSDQQVLETASSVEIKEMNPEYGKVLEFEARDEAEYNNMSQIFFAEFDAGNFDFNLIAEKLNAEQKRIYEKYGHNEAGGFWGVPTNQRYDGIHLNQITASSFLPPDTANVTYEPSNTHDGSYRTAWVEGAEGYGIGEYVTYHFAPTTHSFKQIIIANGYISSGNMYRNNSRVKKLKVYIDNIPLAILNLEDIRREQIFTFERIGVTHNNPWALKFEIMEVYQGDRYDDTAITLIYFDGIEG